MILIALTLDSLEGFATGFSADPRADPSGRFSAAVSNIVAVITIFAGLSFLIWFVVGALTWITAADHADKLEKAKNQMSSALIGLVIVILTIPFVYLIGKILGIDILNAGTIFKLLMPT